MASTGCELMTWARLGAWSKSNAVCRLPAAAAGNGSSPQFSPMNAGMDAVSIRVWLTTPRRAYGLINNVATRKPTPPVGAT